MFNYTPLTVSEAIAQLRKLPQDAHLVTRDYDSDWGGAHYSQVYKLEHIILKDKKKYVEVQSGLCEGDWYVED
jgi:hypothetical protein